MTTWHELFSELFNILFTMHFAIYDRLIEEYYRHRDDGLVKSSRPNKEDPPPLPPPPNSDVLVIFGMIQGNGQGWGTNPLSLVDRKWEREKKSTHTYLDMHRPIIIMATVQNKSNKIWRLFQIRVSATITFEEVEMSD